MSIKPFTYVIMVSLCAAHISFALPQVEDAGEPLSSEPSNHTLTAMPVPSQNQSFEANSIATPAKMSNIHDDILDKVNALEQQVQTLQGRVDELQHDLKQAKEEQAKQFLILNQKIVTRPFAAVTPALVAVTAKSNTVKASATNNSTAATVKTTAPAKETVTKTNDVVSPIATTSDDQEKATYEAAYGLVSSHAYADAIDAFQGYLQIFPEGKYTANANYWLGELHANQQQYPAAIKYLEVVVNQYPQSSKTADAMLKLGIINKRLGNDNEAQSWFNKLLKKYPQSAQAQSAKKYIV